MRSRIARFVGAVVASALAGATLGGCASQVRSVTHISSWSTAAGDYFYVCYAENEMVSRVSLCRVQPDNTVLCVDQPEVDRLLNSQ